MQASECDGRTFVLARDGRFRRTSSPPAYLHLALPSSPFSPASPAASHLRTEFERAPWCRRARHHIRPRSLRLVFAANSHNLSRASTCGGTRRIEGVGTPHAHCQDTGGVPMNSADNHALLDRDGRPFD